MAQAVAASARGLAALLGALLASPEALQSAMASDGTGAIRADVANYTTITPVLQTSEIV